MMKNSFMELVMCKPDDWHVHFRDWPMLKNFVPYTAEQFARALVMPNTKLPVSNGGGVTAYERTILKGVPSRLNFKPLMTFKITPGTTAEDVISAQAAGAIAGKLYPDGVTTNSEGGVRDFESIFEIFAIMQDVGLVLCLHGEHPDAECMDREKRFIDEVLYKIVESFPKLRVVLEHISTEAGVTAVSEMSPLVAGTITAHHLELTHTDVIGGLLKPHLFCKPIAKWKKDRDKLLEAAVSGNPKFFFGSDSAPHYQSDKECAEGCAGIFSAPVALPVLAGVFERLGCLNNLQAFVSQFGAEFYRLPLNQEQITLVKKEWHVPDTICSVVPYHAGETLAWSLKM